MTKLNQMIAIGKGVRTGAQTKFTKAYHELQKTSPMSGIARTYQPKDDEGDALPPESTRVQFTARDVLHDVGKDLSRMFDVQMTLDVANTEARADVEIDGETLIHDVPVSFLLFLEKQLIDIQTLVAKLPVLDPATAWTFSATAGNYASEPVQTTRTQKVPRNHLVAAATEKHAAQVQVYHEDIIVGTWTTTRFSGALPATEVRAMSERVTKLREAVKMAREKANSIDVADWTPGPAILTYLFG